MLCTPCPWNTTCPCGVQQMTGPTCVVPPAWVSFVLSRSGRVLTPFLLQPTSPFSSRVSRHAYPRRSGVSWHGHGSHGDLLASWHPSCYENRRDAKGSECGRARPRRARGPSRDTAARITRATSLIFLLQGTLCATGVVMTLLYRICWLSAKSFARILFDQPLGLLWKLIF